MKIEAAKRKDGRVNTLNMDDISRAQHNKITPLKTGDEESKKPSFVRMEKNGGVASTNEEASKAKDGDFEFAKADSKDGFDEI